MTPSKGGMRLRGHILPAHDYACGTETAFPYPHLRAARHHCPPELVFS